MAGEPKSKDDGAHSVSSSRRAQKSVTFSVPIIPKPNFKKVNTSRVRFGLLTVAFVAVAFFSGMAGSWVQSNRGDDQVVASSLSNQKKIVTSQSQLISQISKTVGPSVVSVNVSITTATPDIGSQFGFFGFSQPSNQQAQAAGTGIIISSSGIIVTNRHVVPAGTTSVSVTLSDGTELKNVSVIGRTNDSDSLDVAFLKVNDAKGHKLTPAVLGDSSTVLVGDNVVAIGNALGQFQNTVTSGIISGYGRSVQAGSSGGGFTASSYENLEDLFQTDAAINEGNSGGPLVNLNGQVIGINTAVASNSQNIGFAIPINDIRGLIDQVLKTGKFERAYLGVRYIPLTADVANMYKLSVQNGAYIAASADPTTPSVVADSPAAQAGLQTGDVITEVDNTAIDQTHSLTGILDQHQPGDSISLTVIRDGKTMHLRVTLGTVPSN
jgi:serine protease Do